MHAHNSSDNKDQKSRNGAYGIVICTYSVRLELGVLKEYIDPAGMKELRDIAKQRRHPLSDHERYAFMTTYVLRSWPKLRSVVRPLIADALEGRVITPLQASRLCIEIARFLRKNSRNTSDHRQYRDMDDLTFVGLVRLQRSREIDTPEEFRDRFIGSDSMTDVKQKFDHGLRWNIYCAFQDDFDMTAEDDAWSHIEKVLVYVWLAIESQVMGTRIRKLA